MEPKKAYGVVTAIGAKLGEKARGDPSLLERIRAAASAQELRAIVRTIAQGLVPEALLAQFAEEIVTEAEWVQWRSRLLLQMKLTATGKDRAPGHEAGRGVGRPQEPSGET